MTTSLQAEDEPERLELRLLADDTRGDRAAVSALLADSFVEFRACPR